MRTELILIDSSGTNMDLALNYTEGLADLNHLSKKDRLHLRLLAEELFSMVTAIIGSFSAAYWAENKGREYRLILQAESDLDESEKRELLSLASSGEKISGGGIMTKLWKLFQASLDAAWQSAAAETPGCMTDEEARKLYGRLGTAKVENEDGALSYVWSLKEYRKNAETAIRDADLFMGSWEELEKSIVANIASDVQVSIAGNQVQMVLCMTVS